jgi:hypothetical protein
MAAFRAFIELRGLEQQRRTANYFHWRTSCETNATDQAKTARKHLYEANSHRTDVKVCCTEFEKGFAAWKPLLAVPRKLNPNSSDVAFLLGTSTSALPFSFIMQPVELFERTEFGKNAQAQGDLGVYHDLYLIVRTEQQAANMMQAGVAAWELSQFATQHLAAPLGGGPGMLLPGGPKPIPLNELESAILVRAIGPLDLYLHEDVMQGSARRQRPEVAREMPTTAPTPPTTFQPTGASR